MNIQLAETEEYIDGKHTGALGMVLIRSVKRMFLRNTARVSISGNPLTRNFSDVTMFFGYLVRKRTRREKMEMRR